MSTASAGDVRRDDAVGQHAGMVSVSDLRQLGEDELAAVLGRRPDVLVPAPPRSLAELAARLCHPFSLALALRPMNRATLQVAEALAALGPLSDRRRLDDLLGVRTEQQRVAVEEALTTLSVKLLLQERQRPAEGELGAGPDAPSGSFDGDLRLLPQAASLWTRPLGLGASLEELLPERTVTDLQRSLRAFGERGPTRKAEVLERLVAVLSDRDRVVHAVRTAPTDVARRLRRAALGRPVFYPPSGYPSFGGRRAQPDSLSWAVDRMMVVPTGWYGQLTMPAEVAMALRGPDWHAPFDPVPPPLAWTQNAEALVERESAAAAAHALRTVGAVLQQLGDTPMALLKSGAVGVRELRRIAKQVGCQVGEVRLTLALALWADLIGLEEERVTPTVDFDAWLAAPPARRLAWLVDAWVDLPECPMAAPESAWQPETDPELTTLRLHLLDEMSHHPGASPTSLEALAHWSLWQVPMWRRTMLGELHDPGLYDLDDGPSVDAADLDDLDDLDDLGEPAAREEILGAMTDTIRTLLAEAAWLGLTGAGALSASGAAVIGGDDVAGVAEAGLGAVQHNARLQADLTAVVLGHPSPRLAEVLDQLAERESRSTAATWRFSPASLRRAMDAGLDESTIGQMLATVAEDEVPQPLTYLVGDVGRRHGRLRVGEISSYLRCEDDLLLTELLADRSLRRLELRRIGPGVVGASVGAASLLGTLRTNGYLPVLEDGTGAVVVERQESRRVRTPDLPFPPGAGQTASMSAQLSGPAEPDDRSAPIELGQVAAALLAGPDHPVARPAGLMPWMVDPDLIDPDLIDPDLIDPDEVDPELLDALFEDLLRGRDPDR